MEIVKIDPEILGGTPCFAGTRVPVSFLFEYIRLGYNIDYFLYQFPSVPREKVVALLDLMERQAQSDLRAAG